MIIILHGPMHISPTRRVRSVGVTPRPQDYQKYASPKIKLQALPKKGFLDQNIYKPSLKFIFWARWSNFLVQNYIFGPAPNYLAQNVFSGQLDTKMSFWASQAWKCLPGLAHPKNIFLSQTLKYVSRYWRFTYIQ